MTSNGDFPELRTDRLLLRRVTVADVQTVYEGLSDPIVTAFYGISYATLADTHKQIDWYDNLHRNGTGIWWAISSLENPREMFGAIGFSDLLQHYRRAELGYWLLPRHWGNGYVTEALEAALAYAFDALRLVRIGAKVELDNVRSFNVLKRAGFHFEGVKRAAEVKNGAPLDLAMLSRLSTDR